MSTKMLLRVTKQLFALNCFEKVL